MARVVAILGDSLALPGEDRRGPPFTRYVEDVLQQYGVELLNWSKPDQAAVMLATEGLEEVQSLVRGVTAQGKELFVIVEVGTFDRIDFADMLPESLGMLVRVIIAEGARPLLMEVVPDGIDSSLAQEQGAGLIPVPASVSDQFNEEPTHPFKPKEGTQRDLAQSVLEALEAEMHLPLTAPALDGDDADQRRNRGMSRSRAVHDDELLLAAAASGDIQSLQVAWEKAEQAIAHSVEMRRKDHMAAERARVEADRQWIEEAREQLKVGMRTLQEETERVSAVREVGAH